MKNFEIARLFDLMADVLELQDETVFRIRAYRRAAQNLESLSSRTDYVVVGEDPGKKLDAARRLGVARLGEAGFLRMVRHA